MTFSRTKFTLFELDFGETYFITCEEKIPKNKSQRKIALAFKK